MHRINDPDALPSFNKVDGCFIPSYRVLFGCLLDGSGCLFTLKEQRVVKRVVSAPDACLVFHREAELAGSLFYQEFL